MTDLGYSDADETTAAAIQAAIAGDLESYAKIDDTSVTTMALMSDKTGVTITSQKAGATTLQFNFGKLNDALANTSGTPDAWETIYTVNVAGDGEITLTAVSSEEDDTVTVTLDVKLDGSTWTEQEMTARTDGTYTVTLTASNQWPNFNVKVENADGTAYYGGAENSGTELTDGTAAAMTVKTEADYTARNGTLWIKLSSASAKFTVTVDLIADTPTIMVKEAEAEAPANTKVIDSTDVITTFEGTSNGWDNFAIYEITGDELTKLQSVEITCYNTVTTTDTGYEAGGNTWLTKDKDNPWGTDNANVVSNQAGISGTSATYTLTPTSLDGLSSVWLCVQNGAHTSSWGGGLGTVTVEKVVLNFSE